MDDFKIGGTLVIEVFSDGVLKSRQELNNVVTEAGDRFYGERAAAGVSGSPITAPATVKGMQLGTSPVAATKTGAGAAVGGFITGSNVALDSGWPTSTLLSGKRRIQYRCTWPVNVATSGTINEVVLGFPAALGTGAWTAAAVVGRAVFSETINKLSNESLVVTWNHDIGG